MWMAVRADSITDCNVSGRKAVGGGARGARLLSYSTASLGLCGLRPHSSSRPSRQGTQQPLCCRQPGQVLIRAR